jgi:hypothetical protein
MAENSSILEAVVYFRTSPKTEHVELESKRSSACIEAMLSAACRVIATTRERNRLSEPDQKAKLRLVKETVREVWGEARP